MPAYDAAAASFDRHRAPPKGVPDRIRDAILAAIRAPHPRLLDLGAGTGRIGAPFVAADDDYVAVDLSLAMLHRFAARFAADDGPVPHLVQADGRALPFPDSSFDGVMLIQVFGGLAEWRSLLAEVRRVLRTDGTLVIGRTSTPPQGLDARMKKQLAVILAAIGADHNATNPREEIERWLADTAQGARQVPAAWDAIRTPRSFLDRHRTGARFAALPEPAKQQALGKLAAWAVETFGSLDAACSESHHFELRIYRFDQPMDR